MSTNHSTNESPSNKQQQQLQQQQNLHPLKSDKTLAIICKSNGITKDVFDNHRHSVKEIEMFMHHNYKRLAGLHYFTNLMELRIVNQGIEKIEGLDNLIHLRKLWLNENKISVITGLKNLSELRELYLHGNQIVRITGFKSLINLEKLWIFDNKIETVEGLETLAKLRILWIGGNRIESIPPGAFDSNECLTELNIAGNLIGQFKEIPLFDRIKSLESLSLKCTNFSENPVCGLCNYQTYALYHLTRIKKLDNLTITEEARHIADATFLKKKMYYNMRIKTLKRNATNVLNRAKDLYQERCNDCNLNLNVLTRMKRELERELEEATYLPKWIVSPNTLSPSDAIFTRSEEEEEKFLNQLKTKCVTINAEIRRRIVTLSELQTRFNTLKEQVHLASEINIGRLLLELDTGGNIRLEEGKIGDVWFHSCVDLIKSRFFVSDFEPLGYSGLSVQRVTRIHNRYLRNRFEKQLDEVVDTSDNSYKRSLEYLFYGDGLDPSSNILTIIEDGFPSPRGYSNRGLDPAVVLSNSVSICEAPRIQKLIATNQIDPKAPLRGSLIIAKVFLGNFKSDKKSVSRPGSSQGEESGTSIRLDNFPGADSVYRTKAGDAKQRKWFIFDQKLILPEYFVEYEMLPAVEDERMKNYEKMQEEITTLFNVNSDVDLLDIRSHAPHFSLFHAYCRYLADKIEEESEAMSTALSMAPALTQRKKNSMISRYSISQTARCTTLSNIQYLNLYGNNIRKIEYLEDLTQLKILVLSFNEIEKIEGLDKCEQLERLDLDFNLIKKIEGVDKLQKLKILRLNNNLIYRVEDILSLHADTLPQLTDITLSSNAICDIPSYRYIIVRRIQKLATLDEIEVTDEERIFAVTKLHVITDQLILNAVSNAKTLGFSLSYSPEIKPTLVNTQHENWHSSILDLDLSGKRLRRITNMEKLVNLKRLNLSRNEIVRIEHLQENSHLQELCLEDNRISRIEGLSSLQNLRKLELANNRITKIENLELCARVTQLSLECNQIETLSGIEKLVNLMELYVANNKLKSIQEILYLKQLNKLIILDLSGNLVCSEKQYRLYTIFNLKKLKVLDGVSIDAGESQMARDEFSGKVTTDVLRQVLGETDDYASVHTLNLSNSGIKHLSNTTSSIFDRFLKLKELNLQQNIITSLNGLHSLSESLIVLKLDGNRLGETNSNAVNNQIGKYFDNLVNLEVLSLDENHISNMLCLQLNKLRNLRLLSLNRNDITKIEGLQGVSTNLREIRLERNRIRFIDHSVNSAVSEMVYIPNLLTLRLDENCLRTLDGIQYLPSLSTLFCGSNRIADVNELEKLTELCSHGNLRELSLAFNPVTRKSIYRPTVVHYCPSIIMLDGKEVLTDERQRAAVFFAQEYFQSTGGTNVFTTPSHSPDTVGQIRQGRVPVRVAAVGFEFASNNGAPNSVSPMITPKQESGNKGSAVEQTSKDIERFLLRGGRSANRSLRSQSQSSQVQVGLSTTAAAYSAPSVMPRAPLGSLRNATSAPKRSSVGKFTAAKQTVQTQSFTFTGVVVPQQTPRQNNQMFPKV